MSAPHVVWLLLTAVVVACDLYNAWHFWSRFQERRHPLSVVAALKPVGWIVAALLVLHPSAATEFRAVVLTLALFEGVLSALMVYLSRRHGGRRRASPNR